MIDTNDKLPNDITLEKRVILMACTVKDGNKVYTQLFLDHVLYDK